MKKLLSILAAVGLTATASTAVVACSSVKVKDGAIEMTVKNTADSTWGKDAKSITQLFESSTDKKIKDIAKHIKKELGITDWRDASKAPVMITTYFGTTKPSFKDGATVKDSEVNANSNTDANKASFDADAKAGKTLYIVLRKADADAFKKDGANWSTKVAVIKLSFTKIA